MKKKVICAKELEEVLERGESKYFIKEEYILTPAAQDIIQKNKIEIVYQEETKLEMDKFIEMFKILIKKGMLETLVKELSKEKTYSIETDESGMKIVRTSTLKMEKLKGKNVCYREFEELVENMVIGILNISQDNFFRKLKYKEANYIINGEIKVLIEKREYTVKEGDILVLPENIAIDFICEQDTKILYMSEKSNMEVR